MLKSALIKSVLGFFSVIVAFNTEAQTESPSPPPFILVSKTPLLLQSVSERTICGSTLASPSKLQCVGDSGTGRVNVNDTVSRLDHLIMMQGQLCAKDERGIQCWRQTGNFGKPLQTLLAKGDTKRVRSNNRKVCLPVVEKNGDSSIHCHPIERGVWTEIPDGKGGTDNRFKLVVPETEIYGPFKDLRDFQVIEEDVCALNSDTVICDNRLSAEEKSTLKKNRTRDGVSGLEFSGARSLTVSWNRLCVLAGKTKSENKLTCFLGEDFDKVVRVEVPGDWSKTTHLSQTGYGTICSVDEDQRPNCFSFDDGTTTLIDKTPAELIDKNIKILKFKADGDIKCAMTETSNGQRSLLCSDHRGMEQMPIASDLMDFDISNDAVCASTKDGLVSCFYSTLHLESPLPEDGSPSHTLGRCRWNSSRFHCSTVETSFEFSKVKSVVDAVVASGINELPCMIYEVAGGVRQLHCFGFAQNLVDSAPPLHAEHEKLAASSRVACVYGGESASCWSVNEDFGSDMKPPNLTNAKKILLSEDFGCANDQFGLVCWGQRLTDRGLTVPSSMTDVDYVKDFGVGTGHACALTRENQIACWGENGDGQTNVPTLTNPISLAVSGNTSCASADEGVVCWGAIDRTLQNSVQSAILNSGSK